MSGRCIMMCAGDFHPMEIDAQKDDFVIAVDGGLKFLMEAGIEPDLLLGDFDSLEGEFTETIEMYRARGEEHFLQLPVVKNDTDTMAAARIGIRKGYREFLIYGGTGGRPDHFMANIQTMNWIQRNGGQAFMLDREARMTVIGPGIFRIPDGFDGTVSMFALDRRLEGVTIRGMKYCLENATVTNDYPVGISNETLPRGEDPGAAGKEPEEAFYSIGEGTALLIMTEKLINRHH